MPHRTGTSMNWIRSQLTSQTAAGMGTPCASRSAVLRASGSPGTITGVPGVAAGDAWTKATILAISAVRKLLLSPAPTASPAPPSSPPTWLPLLPLSESGVAPSGVAAGEVLPPLVVELLVGAGAGAGETTTPGIFAGLMTIASIEFAEAWPPTFSVCFSWSKSPATVPTPVHGGLHELRCIHERVHASSEIYGKCTSRILRWSIVFVPSDVKSRFCPQEAGTCSRECCGE